MHGAHANTLSCPDCLAKRWTGQQDEGYSAHPSPGPARLWALPSPPGLRVPGPVLWKLFKFTFVVYKSRQGPAQESYPRGRQAALRGEAARSLPLLPVKLSCEPHSFRPWAPGPSSLEAELMRNADQGPDRA